MKTSGSLTILILFAYQSASFSSRYSPCFHEVTLPQEKDGRPKNRKFPQIHRIFFSYLVFIIMLLVSTFVTMALNLAYVASLSSPPAAPCTFHHTFWKLPIIPFLLSHSQAPSPAASPVPSSATPTPTLSPSPVSIFDLKKQYEGNKNYVYISFLPLSR